MEAHEREAFAHRTVRLTTLPFTLIVVTTRPSASTTVLLLVVWPLAVVVLSIR